MAAGRLRAVERPLDEIGEKPLQALLAYWRQAAAGRPWLPYAELRPEQFGAALAFVALIERQPGDDVLRIRLCGAGVENAELGFVRGAAVNEISPGWYRDHLLQEYGSAIDRAVPIHQHIAADYEQRRFAYSRLLLPLTRSGTHCDSLMVATVGAADMIRSMRVARRSA